MADSNIGALPQAEGLEDDSLLVAEQQGQAVKVTGAQFKEFGRQAVVGQVQGYVDQAQAAASQAVSAVSAVTEMTVEAQASQEASVTKSTRAGKVHLTFGLPRGEQGVPGPEGPAGAQGPRGETGKGLDILGYYDTQTALEAAVTAPEPGDAYGVGTEAPFDIFVFDGVSGTWKNNGPLSGGGGIVPENVVTSEGGAALEIPDSFGGAPHVITFDEEEDVPLTAEDIAYGDASVAEALGDLFTCVSDGKALIASAITDKGVPTQPDAAFSELAEHVGQISGGADTADATATSFDILAPKTAYTAHGKVEGVIPSLGARTYTPGTQAQTIANGQYLSGVQTIQGDSNLTSGNIKKGVSIFGVEGAVEQSFLATLTVTADVGAVVTASHTGGTEVEALSTTGTVTLELPLEGEWTVTARRGVAQYNSVVVNVSSQYSAALTAEVHVEYFGEITGLSEKVFSMASATMADCAIVAGGRYTQNGNDYAGSVIKTTSIVNVYDKNVTKTNAVTLNKDCYGLAAASTDDISMFAGGISHEYSNTSPYNAVYTAVVTAYDRSLTRTTPVQLSAARAFLAGASIGSYCVFGGGEDSSNAKATVDAYSKSGARGTPTGLAVPAVNLAAASNEKYAIFAGGNETSAVPTAYNSELTRSLPVSLSTARKDLAAAAAGNYVLFAGGNGPLDVVDAYDLFLTRTIPEPLSVARYGLKGTSLNGIAIFGGGRINSERNNPSYSGSVDAYDQFLVRTNPDALKKIRAEHTAAAVDGYALFCGGSRIPENSATHYYLDSVEAYRYV